MACPDGGPAFPGDRGYDFEGQRVVTTREGMSLRDYFAAHAPGDEVDRFIPDTVGEVADLLDKLGWIKRDRSRAAVDCYSESHRRRLRAWARYQYADLMLAARTERRLT